MFGKNHADVLRDVRALVSNLAEYGGEWFRATTFSQKVGYGTRQMPAYEMSRDGFSLLVMGYTGEKALRFRVAYINEFSGAGRASTAWKLPSRSWITVRHSGIRPFHRGYIQIWIHALAVKLGFARLAKRRDAIGRNADEVAAYGILPRHGKNQNISDAPHNGSALNDAAKIPISSASST